jgi:hypothetical protein
VSPCPPPPPWGTVVLVGVFLFWCVCVWLQLLYFQSLLRQDIGWFDMNSAGDLASRLAE